MADDFNHQSQEFLHWLTKNGAVVSPKIELADYRAQNQGRGVRALEDIPAGEILFSVPRSLVISADNEPLKFREFLGSKKAAADLDPWMRLVVLMLFLNKESPEYRPYFDVLPNQFETLVFWTNDDLKLLKGSCIVEKISKEEAEETYWNTIKPLFDNEPEIDASLEAYHRMNSLIMAYSFDIPELENESEGLAGEQQQREEEDGEYGFVDDENDGLVKAMVPMADMLNAHTKLCNARLMPSDKDDNILEMVAVADIPSGDQVYNSYGDVPNADILRRYGYVEEGGTDYEVVEIKNDLLLEQLKDELALGSEQVSGMVEILQEWEDSEDTLIYDEDTYEIPETGIPDHKLLLLLLYFQFQPFAVDMKQKKLMRAISRIEQLAPFTAEGKKIWISVIEKRLKEYEDNELLSMTDFSTNKAYAAKEVIESEMRILNRSLAWARKEKPLDTREVLQTLTKKRENTSGSTENASPKKARTR